MNPYNKIAKPFWDILDDCLAHKHTHYWLKGGRGSTKSSFIGITLPLLMMIDGSNGIQSSAVCMRKVGDTLEGSVYNQLLWGIEQLGVSDYWKAGKSPLYLEYKPTGQIILFRGCANKDDYRKLKSIKFKKGFCKYGWYEELDEFSGMEEIRSINQSLLRGGSDYEVFYSYNPPKQIASWVNAEVLNIRDDRLVHSSTYLDVPVEWLGEQFIIEAETLKKINELAYRNEYLGEPTGTGGAVFTNITLRAITNEEISHFDNISDGIDFGYAIDPATWGQNHYDKTRKKLYIFNEIYATGLSNKALYEKILQKKIGQSMIIADSAEPKSIDELNSYGQIRVIGAKKGPDSVEYGIKWLQMLEEIIIDNTRCPNTAREFTLYEYEKDRMGNFKSKYPDLDNHTIDMVRYSRENDMRANTLQFGYGRI